MTESLTAPEQPFSWKQFLTKKRYLPKWLIALTKWLFLGAVALCILWAAWRYFFGTQFDTLQLAGYSGEDLSLVPRPVADHSVAPGLSSFQTYGYAFQLPWKDAKPLDKFGREATTTIFAGRQVMTFANPYTKRSMLATLRKMPEYMETTFRQGEFPTDYALLQTELNSVPKDIRYFALPRNAAQTCLLVRLKMFELSINEAQAVETVDTPFVHGFEFLGKRDITLELFDTADRTLEIHFHPSQTAIPQSEINTFITSLHPALEAHHD